MAEQYTHIERHSGAKYYYKDPAMTILHREDGPAIERVNGTREWFVNGVPHRMDGPAFDSIHGHKEWYVNDEFIFSVNREGKLVGRMR